ncbi:flagellar hook assembly protein FlgD [Oceanobacillus longus]|uniref:Flagellar hook assembly protein FlgD n=1 Tax=Oceanobacillus longus TaxID=930120 RepID=A0ABV8GWV1_9BACI
MTTIDTSLYLSNQPKTRIPSADLGKDEFLKILMTQLQNQDPTSPMDDTQFISQMAQFSSLEQTMNMTKSIDTLVQSQLISPVIKYSHMIGKEVTYQAIDPDTGKESGSTSSKVVAVSQNEGWAVLELQTGEKIYADAVTQVTEPELNDKTEQDVDA